MKVVIFGAGENANHIIYNIKNGRTRLKNTDIDYIVDNQRFDQEFDYIDGTKYKIYFPIKLLEDKDEKLIIISSINAYYQISTQLSEFGLMEGRDYIGWGGLIQADWVTMEKLTPFMEYRVQFMASLISDDINSVVDLGCGNMELERYIKKEVEYIPVDYFPHDGRTVLCDLDKGDFPKLKVDAMVIGAVLEHIRNYQPLIKWICESTVKEIILSYTPIEYLNDINIRMKHGCKNHFSVDELIRLFESNYMELVESRINHTIHRPVYRFRRIEEK